MQAKFMYTISDWSIIMYFIHYFRNIFLFTTTIEKKICIYFDPLITKQYKKQLLVTECDI